MTEYGTGPGDEKRFEFNETQPVEETAGADRKLRTRNPVLMLFLIILCIFIAGILLIVYRPHFLDVIFGNTESGPM